MEKEKKPRIPAWKAWILVLSFMQILSAVQSYRVQHQNSQCHQILWDLVNQQAQLLNGHIEISNQYLTEQLQLEKELQENLRQLLGVD